MTNLGNSDTLRKLGGVAAIAASVALVSAACGGSDTAESSTATAPAPASSAMTSGAAAASGYRDGQYTAVGDYSTPGGTQEVGISLTLANSTITAVTVDTSMAKNPKTEEFQGKFASGIAAEIVGKNLDEIDVEKVSGSSLTPKGFDAAVAKIKDEAKA